MIKEDSCGNLFFDYLNSITWKKTYIFIYMAPEFWCPKVTNIKKKKKKKKKQFAIAKKILIIKFSK